MIDLAPNNPNGLELRSPVLVAPGCAETYWRNPAASALGALATRWTRLSPVGTTTRWGSSPAGIVFERLPEAGFRAMLGGERRRWQRSPAPVLLALRGDLDELAEMAQQLERVDGIAGLLIDAPVSVLGTIVHTIRSSTLLPLLALLPAQGAIGEPAQAAASAGVDALLVRAYPPATAQIDGELVQGVLVGPALGPLTVEAVREARAAVELPLVALGGIAGPVLAGAALAAGATVVMVDGALHGDPQAPIELAQALGGRMDGSPDAR